MTMDDSRDASRAGEANRSPRRTRLAVWIAAGTVAVLAITAIAVAVFFPRDHTAQLAWGGGQLSVSADGTPIAIEEAPHTAELATAMANLVPTSYLALRPLDITAESDVPATGVTLSWTIEGQLPPEASITFAYFDEDISMWVPELTTISADRRTVTAVVSHLSLWTIFTSPGQDVIDAIGGLVTDIADDIAESWDRAGEQLYRFTHEILGNSADMPECDGAAPAWTSEAFVTDNVEVDLGWGDSSDGNAAVLLCVGADPNNPDILQVTAAANRGYGFPVSFADKAVPLAAGPSGVDPTIASVLQFGSSFFTSGEVFAPNRFVYATQEFTATFIEQSARDAGSGRIISFDLPAADQVVLSSGLKIMIDVLEPGSQTVAGILAVLSLIESCEFGELNTLRDVSATVAWMAACASSLDGDSIADAMNVVAADVFETNDPEIAEGLTKKSTLLRTVSAKLKALLIFSVAQVIIDYVGDSITEDVSSYPVSFVQITLAPERPSIESLYGTYTRRSTDDGFTTMTLDAAGIRMTACSACGDVPAEQQLMSAEWDGSCFAIVNTVTSFGSSYDENWLLCPSGFGGPGDATTDRLGTVFRGAPPSTDSDWYVRD